jgi:hypothetical protein
VVLRALRGESKSALISVNPSTALRTASAVNYYFLVFIRVNSWLIVVFLAVRMGKIFSRKSTKSDGDSIYYL